MRGVPNKLPARRRAFARLVALQQLNHFVIVSFLYEPLGRRLQSLDEVDERSTR